MSSTDTPRLLGRKAYLDKLTAGFDSDAGQQTDAPRPFPASSGKCSFSLAVVCPGAGLGERRSGAYPAIRYCWVSVPASPRSAALAHHATPSAGWCRRDV